jgi:SAM-dependent methyltransferase
MTSTNVIQGVTVNYDTTAVQQSVGATCSIPVTLEIQQSCVFNPVLRAGIYPVTSLLPALGCDSHQSSLFFPWLPQGIYSFVLTIQLSLTPALWRLGVQWGTPELVIEPETYCNIELQASTNSPLEQHMSWTMTSETEQRIRALSWNQGLSNWFHRHFCHAANVIGEQFLENSPELKGRVLDIGAGDGITDLGLIMRYQPEEFVAVDIVDYLTNLPEIATSQDLPLQQLPDCMTFLQQSCESLPYADGYFDLVISWGSIEHIKDGYHKTLDEVWRVLKPGGLFFLNPGLYYAPYGSHLGEFSDIPHLHLKIEEQALKDHVLNTDPDTIDRSGFDVDNAEFWRFYKELNKIHILELEQELRQYGYYFVNAGLQGVNKVSYTDEMQQYSILDLAIDDAFFTLRKPG